MSIWTWLVGTFWRSRCVHDWEQYEVMNVLYRGCVRCDRIERFEPDCGGNTAGHWDEVAK